MPLPFCLNETQVYLIASSWNFNPPLEVIWLVTFVSGWISEELPAHIATLIQGSKINLMSRQADLNS